MKNTFLRRYTGNGPADRMPKRKRQETESSPTRSRGMKKLILKGNYSIKICKTPWN